MKVLELHLKSINSALRAAPKFLKQTQKDFKKCRVRKKLPEMQQPAKEKKPDQLGTNSQGIDSSEKKFSHLTKTFLNSTMPQVIAPSYAVSFVWFVLYIMFIAILVLQAFLTLRDYYSHPANVEMTFETSSKTLEFPAVTVCNNNIVKKSSIARIPRYTELASLSDYVYQMNLPEKFRNTAKIKELGFYQCIDNPSTWIPKSWVCDGKQDCSDSSDESVELCSSHKALNHSESCLDEFEKCPGESTCAVLCDGVNDCVLQPGYDESVEGGCSHENTIFLTAARIPQNLSSPNFPNIYPNNLDETYIISSPGISVINITFEQFNVEKCDGASCSCDYVTMKDGNGEYFTFDGSTRMCGEMCSFGKIESSTNQVVISFVTDYVHSRSGWSLQYHAIPITQEPHAESYVIAYNTACDNDVPEFGEQMTSGSFEALIVIQRYPSFSESQILQNSS